MMLGGLFGRVGAKLASFFGGGGKALIPNNAFLIQDSKLFFKTAGNAIGEAGAKAGARVISWGSAAKVALVGGLGFVFLSGGLPSLVSKATGLPVWTSQLIITAVIVYLGLSLVRAAVWRIRRAVRPFGGGRRYSGGRR